MTTSAFSSNFSPRTVINPGSPGPAPTKYTMPLFDDLLTSSIITEGRGTPNDSDLPWHARRNSAQNPPAPNALITPDFSSRCQNHDRLWPGLDRCPLESPA